MSMKLPFAALTLLLPAAAAVAGVPWHHPLAVGRGGLWQQRVPVTIENRSDNAAAGDLAEVALPALAGQPISALRVCDAAGHELLFDVRNYSGSAPRDGQLTAEDRIVLPVECPAHGKATLYVYAGNDRAADPGEYLPAWFANGQFEQGKTTPDAWQPAEADAAHRVLWDKHAGRNGTACGKVEVEAGAEPKWTKWVQTNLRLSPGTRYRVSAWVRAENVQGDAGWFLHVNGDQPMILQQMLHGGGGTYDWKQVSYEFTAPPEAKTATFGTVLRGTGTAWFDDAEFVALDESSRWKIEAGPIERFELNSAFPPESPARIEFIKLSAEWPVCATVICRNFTNKEASGVTTVDFREILASLRGVPRDAALRATTAESEPKSLSVVRIGDSALFTTTIPARSERLFYLYFSAHQRVSAMDALADYGRLVASPANLAPNLNFDTDGARVRDWQLSGEGRAVDRGDAYSHAVELRIPPTEKPVWNGWRSKRIPVEPRATYFFMAFAQSEGLVGRAPLYAHFYDVAGKLTPSRAMATSAGSVSGDAPWTSLSMTVDTAPEAATAELHLTTNATAGTLRHAGVFFCRTLPADLLRIKNCDELANGGTTQIWQVNPLVKIFPDTPPGEAVKSVGVECARNEYEPFELVLRSSDAQENGSPVTVSVSPLVNAFGFELPPVKVDRVGFVPVDHPSAYYRFDGPDYYRPMPNHQGGTDGWAGDWPDPLIPNAPFTLPSDRSQPLWFTVQVPTTAAAGEYHATITITANEQEKKIPLVVRVLPFALPGETHLKVIFDWRWGRGGDYGMGAPELKRTWLQLLRDHRMGINMVEPAPVFTIHAGKVHMDATAFDDAARECFDRLGLSVSYLPQFFYSFGWAYPAKEIFGRKPFTPEFNDAFRQAYKLMSDHLREHGWHDRFVYYVADEPHYGEPHVIDQMIKLCALAHSVDPTIPIYSSTWTHFPKWDDSLDIWGAGHHGVFPVEDMQDLQKRGKHIWFTCDGQMAIDTPYLATERTLPYYCEKYGVEGFEYWGLSRWTFDPWTHGFHSFIRQSDDGKTYYSTRYPDGDGYLTYPGSAVGVNGPVSSIRLEEIREGIEDYEAMLMLKKLMAKARAQGRDVAHAEHALTAARELVTIPNSSGLRSTENLPDPDKLPAARKLVNAAITSLLP